MMISNLDKYKKDLERLIDDGHLLLTAMQASYHHEEFQDSLRKNLKDEKKVSEFLERLPSFTNGYQVWYSEALALLKQLLPDRVVDFVKLYEKSKTTRKSITYENYVIEDALQGLDVTRGIIKEKIVGPDAAIPRFKQQLNIIRSVKTRFESSLFDIKQLVQADLFDSELDSAKELNKKGFVRASGAVAGVVLESHLQQVCENHRITIRKKNPGINDLAQLLKDSEVIDTPEWRKIQHLADLRNLCDHKKKAEPSGDDIDQLIAGVSRIIKTLY